MAPRTTVSLLIVDDNDDDLELMRLALAEMAPGRVDYRTACDGMDALQKLGEMQSDGTPPSMVIADLKMPRLDGRGLLRELRSRDEWALLPVLILSTSAADADVSGCYRDGCNAYFSKPIEFTRLLQLMDTILMHWGVWAQLPPIAMRR